MRIKVVKLFQAISIDGRVESSVQNELSTVGMGVNKPTDITITETPHGVSFRKKGSDECTVTTWHNIQYIVYEGANEAAKKETSKAK